MSRSLCTMDFMLGFGPQVSRQACTDLVALHDTEHPAIAIMVTVLGAKAHSAMHPLHDSEY